MADYKTAIEKTLNFEGAYVNDPVDTDGGETYCGISRNNFPHWVGWILIDNVKHQSNFPKILSENDSLTGFVHDFYKKEFWDMVGGDKINDQSIADILLDSAVNEGIRPAVKRAQEIAGLPQTGLFSGQLANAINNLA